MTAPARGDVVELHAELAALRELHDCSERDNAAQRRHYVATIVAQREHIANLRLALATLHVGAEGDAAAVLEAALRTDAVRLERLGADRRPEDEKFIGELIAQRIAARRERARERGEQ